VAGATAAVLTVGCALVVAVGQPLIRLWAGPGVVPPVSLLVALSLWTVYATFMTQVSYLLNAAEIVGPQVVMALAMAAVNLGVSLYLTHRIGIIGPVVGSLVAHLAVNGVPAVLIARRVLAGNGPGAEGLRRPQRIWR
jgi:O-antigen/teichoic acid export membrane protein